MKTTTVSILMLSFLLFSGCASIIHGNHQVVDFTSQPTGAKLTINGQDYGSTPQSINLRRLGRFKGDLSGTKHYDIKIEMEGYYPYELKVKRDLDGWFFGNIIFGGIIGIIIDAASGSMYKLTPDQVIATLGTPVALTEKDSDEIIVAVTLTSDPNWEKIGDLTKK